MPAAIPAALPVVGALAGKLIGGKQKATAAVPQDLQGTRQNQIGLMNYLLGFGGPPPGLQQRPGGVFGGIANQMGMFGGQQNPQPNFNFGGPASQTGQINFGQQGVGGAMQQNPFGQQGLNFGGQGPNIGPNGPGGMQQGGGVDLSGMGQFGPIGTMGGGRTPQQPPGGGLLDDRLQSYFGNLGVNRSGLQNQATNAISRYLTQQSPEQRAFEAANPFMQNIGGNQPGSLGGFYNNAINNPNVAGPGMDVEGLLGQFMQT